MGGIYGCGCKEVYNYIDFLVLLIPTPLVSVLFCSSSISTFRSFFYVFRSCYTYTPILVPLQSILVMTGPPRDGS